MRPVTARLVRRQTIREIERAVWDSSVAVMGCLGWSSTSCRSPGTDRGPAPIAVLRALHVGLVASMGLPLAAIERYTTLRPNTVRWCRTRHQQRLDGVTYTMIYTALRESLRSALRERGVDPDALTRLAGDGDTAAQIDIEDAIAATAADDGTAQAQLPRCECGECPECDAYTSGDGEPLSATDV